MAFSCLKDACYNSRVRAVEGSCQVDGITVVVVLLEAAIDRNIKWLQKACHLCRDHSEVHVRSLVSFDLLLDKLDVGSIRVREDQNWFLERRLMSLVTTASLHIPVLLTSTTQTSLGCCWGLRWLRCLKTFFLVVLVVR